MTCLSGFRFPRKGTMMLYGFDMRGFSLAATWTDEGGTQNDLLTRWSPSGCYSIHVESGDAGPEESAVRGSLSFTSSLGIREAIADLPRRRTTGPEEDEEPARRFPGSFRDILAAAAEAAMAHRWSMPFAMERSLRIALDFYGRGGMSEPRGISGRGRVAFQWDGSSLSLDPFDMLPAGPAEDAFLERVLAAADACAVPVTAVAEIMGQKDAPRNAETVIRLSRFGFELSGLRDEGGWTYRRPVCVRAPHPIRREGAPAALATGMTGADYAERLRVLVSAANEKMRGNPEFA